MWLSRKIYESLPYYYVAVGIATLIVIPYVNYWYWPMIAMVIGFGSITAGLVVWLRRRDYRASRSRIETR